MDFIGEFDIDVTVCDKLIQEFENKLIYSHRGTVMSGQGENVYRPDHKSSADLHSMFIEPSLVDEYYDELDKCMLSYIDQYPELNGLPHFSSPQCRIQKYEKGEGFPQWHYERGNTEETYYRCLVYMTYLNDVTDGGETEFKYQNKKVIPKKGKTLIWPAEWTYTHRGNKVNSGVKYIITGWMVNTL